MLRHVSGNVCNAFDRTFCIYCLSTLHVEVHMHNNCMCHIICTCVGIGPTKLPQLWAHNVIEFSLLADDFKDDGLSLYVFKNDSSHLVLDGQRNHKDIWVKVTQASACKSYVVQTCVRATDYESPPHVFHFPAAPRRSRLIPAWFIWIWILYSTAARLRAITPEQKSSLSCHTSSHKHNTERP